MDISSLSGYSYDIANSSLSENKINSIASKAKDNEQLMEACKEFESYFLKLMYNEMDKTIDRSNSLIKESQGEKIFKDLLVEEQAKSMAFDGNGIGLARQLYDQISRD